MTPKARRSRSKLTALPSWIDASPLFRPFNGDARRTVEQLATEIAVPAGEVLVREGTRAKTFGVIVSGGATVSVNGEPMAALSPGDHFGEIGLLDISVGEGDYVARHTATVIASEASVVALMSRPEFHQLCGDHPAIGEALHEVARDRYTPDRAR